MGDGYNFQVLSQQILTRSQATDWDTARKEWVLTDIYESDEAETCLCEHWPIREICVIRNRLNGQSTEVGNVCVKRFLGIRSDLIFAGIKRIRKDISKSLNADSIVFFHERGIITPWEYGFLQDTKLKRVLTVRQTETRENINRKVLATVSRRGIGG
ncbi:hypothetical protein [Bradyrhizobium quebecense]|uniref:Uncharacterized protein n=2 Tax=Bradyrhizobium quebecense TaxID=2748629 RepID=A0ACD3VEB0_9BRAD|nr:hypothetical protein [Bradyrhizobium quebecense]UGY04765.1 hypothetical protein J4P68_0008485 [Bradyrhizobium quebecense]